MSVRVQLGYFGHKWQNKNPANVDLQGFYEAAPTGFEFVWIDNVVPGDFDRSIYFQRFPP